MRAGSIFAAAFEAVVVAVAALLSKSSGIWWRLMELPRVLSGRSTAWAAKGIPSRLDRFTLRVVVLFAYLESTPEEINSLLHIIRVPMLRRETAKDGRRDLRNVVSAMVFRSTTVVFLGVVAVVAALSTAIAFAALDEWASGLGYLATAAIVCVLVRSMTEEVDGQLMVASSPKLTGVLVVFRLMAVGAVVVLINGHGWTDGDRTAHLMGMSAAACLLPAGLAPIRRWLDDGYLGYRRWWAMSWILLSSMAAAVATVTEAITFHGGDAALTIPTHFLGGLTLLVSGLTLAIVAFEPPPLAELDPSKLR
jgi:hypothetical protein